MTTISERSSIRAEAASIEPWDDLEACHLADTLEWIDSGAPLCRTAKPATPPKHLVSYCVVRRHAQLLLVDHRDAGLWLPSGGHVEAGEHPRATARRECIEELGFEPRAPASAPRFVTVTHTVGTSAGHTDVSLWYVIDAESRSRVAPPDMGEFSSVRWFPIAALPERTDPHLRRFAAKLAGTSGDP